MAPVFYFPLLGTPTGEGYQLSFYEAGLSTPLNVWTDSDLTIPFAQPIIFNATGNPDGPIYVDITGPAYKVVYLDADDVPVPGYPVDFVTPSTIPNVTTASITVLTNAQIKALPTTPITLVAAPASGLWIKLTAPPTIQVNTLAGAYTNVNATYAQVSLNLGSELMTLGLVNDSTAAPALSQVTQMFTGATRRVGAVPIQNVYTSAPATPGTLGYVLQRFNTNPFAEYADVNATALTLVMDNNGSGALTGGNAANTMTVTVYYALESLA